MTADLIAYKDALSLLERIDRMPGPEGTKAIATERAQAALELVGRMKNRLNSPVLVAEDDE